MRNKWALPMVSAFFAVLLVVGIVWNGSISDNGADGKQAGATVSENTQKIEENVFPRNKVVDVKITIDKEEFQDMLDNASAEELHSASVEYNGIRMDNVGIRTKGNLSLRSVVNSDSDRYSFKLSFDEYIDSQTMYGISKINLNNNYSDATYMREFLTYELAAEMGLPTPEFSYVNVYVNGELWGFYLAIEQVGDAYLERNFGDSKGSLYKAEFGMGANMNGGDLLWQDDNIESYSALVQKSKKADDDLLIAMLDELNNGTDYEKVLDVENALKYIALNAVTYNMDSYLGSNKQNYYLYEDDGIFSVLPWDYNMAFGGMGGGGGSSILIDEPTQGAVSERPLVSKLLAVDKYKTNYHEIIAKMIEGYLSDDKFEARVKEIQELISPYVKQDPRPFYTYDQYESAIPQLVSFTSNVVTSVSGQLDGTSASSGDGSGSGGGMGGPGGGFGGFGGEQGGQGGPMGQAAPGNTGNGQNGQAVPGNTENGQNGQAAPGNAGNRQNGQAAPGNAGDGQTGQAAPNGQMPGGGLGDFGGMGGGPGGMGGFPGGMGGGPGGFGMPDQGQAQTTGSSDAFFTTLIALAALGLTGLFVTFYKRKR
ncbi:CotH kinase family protein [Cohnella faecalis]|uniref:Spore coat protein CotH n=1 Tax=Cohnella faecalis TaxID=2315694 RepID=A0A398D2P1_9BACL|nr:CotH kinase family protein [Cohnella faecalis]RIE05344.1 spore coat protein CotH [Cohnella faecalis]